MSQTPAAPSAVLLGRIRKLLALSHSPNQHEAALALERAQELLLKHNLAMADVEGRAAAASAVGAEELRLPLTQRWRRHLLALVVQANLCRVVWWQAEGRVHIIGRAENVGVVRELVPWITLQLERISLQETRQHCPERESRLTWRNSFHLAAVRQVGLRLSAARARVAREQDGGQVTALVLAHEGASAAYLQEHYPSAVPMRRRKAHVLADAAVRGTMAGSRVSLTPPSRGLEQRRALAGRAP